MKKKYIILLLITSLISSVSYTQTASIGILTANPGVEILVPVDVTDFLDIGAITLFLGYNANVLTFVSLENIHSELPGVYANAMSNPTQVGITWSSLVPANIATGKLFDLKFIYHGGSSDLTFNPGCEVINSNLNILNVTYTDGSVTPVSSSITASIGKVTASPGTEVLIPVNVTNFADIGAITLFIEYNENVLSFVGIENIHSEITGVQANAMSYPTQVGIIWTANYPNYANIASGKLFDLKFVYNGSTSDLTFSPACEVSDSGLNPLVIEYTDGSISQSITLVTATIATMTASPGNEILIPVDVTGFNNVGAITFFISFDPNVLSFISLENINFEIPGVQANVMSNPTQLGIVWSTSSNPANIGSGKLFDLKFVYNGGTSDLTFEPGCEVSNLSLDMLDVTYFNGGISLSSTAVTATIPDITANPGEEVLIPVDVTNFLDVGAITLFIGYNAGVLNFIGLENIHTEITGVQANAMTYPTQIGIVWTANNPNFANITSGKLFDMKFIYNGSSCDLTFNSGCELTDSGLNIIDVTYFNGSISAIISEISLDLYVFLEGPFNGTNLSPDLNAILPLSQPYSGSPWNYAGTESVASIPNINVVDWILIDLRETTGDASTATSDSIIAQQAAFILNDGSIVGLDGSSVLQFANTITNNLFVVIWHRNHLGVMSANAVTETGGVYTYNFTTGVDQAYGGLLGHKEIGTGVWGMIG
ncbi:MAG: hypothetical protein K8R58_01900, partial [Bacteroidales bacterium]|nr:hypothetical protein [Bacteroidales bacterium]